MPALVRPVLLGAAALIAAAPVHAEQVAQGWLNGAVTVPVDDATGFTLDTSLRFSEVAGGLQQYMIRGTAQTQIAPDVTIGIGYGQSWSYSDGRFTGEEQRPHQDLGIGLGRALGGTIATRTRLEERIFTGDGEVGFRLRERAQYAGPKISSGGIQPVASIEAFYNLNDTDRGARRGFDQLRTTAGLRLPIAGKLTLDASYFNQWIFRRGEDRIGHTALLAFGYKL